MKDGQGFARRVTSENLGQFAPLLGHKSESDSIESPDSQTTREKALLDPELQAAEALFSGNPIKISIPARFFQPRKVKKEETFHWARYQGRDYSSATNSSFGYQPGSTCMAEK